MAKSNQEGKERVNLHYPTSTMRRVREHQEADGHATTVKTLRVLLAEALFYRDTGISKETTTVVVSAVVEELGLAEVDVDGLSASVWSALCESDGGAFRRRRPAVPNA